MRSSVNKQCVYVCVYVCVCVCVGERERDRERERKRQREREKERERGFKTPTTYTLRLNFFLQNWRLSAIGLVRGLVHTCVTK